jgi:uncharacterized protein involved in exopolysaccharide biosynthesis
MSLHQLIAILKARRNVVIFAALLGVVIAAVITAMIPDQYKANASLMVGYKQLGTATDASVPAALYGGYVATQMDLITSQVVAVKAVQELGLLNQPERRAIFENAMQGAGAGIRHALDPRQWFANESATSSTSQEADEQIWANRLRNRIHTRTSATAVLSNSVLSQQIRSSPKR